MSKHGTTIERGIRKRTGKRPYSARYGNRTVSFDNPIAAKICRLLMTDDTMDLKTEALRKLSEHFANEKLHNYVSNLPHDDWKELQTKINAKIDSKYGEPEALGRKVEWAKKWRIKPFAGMTQEQFNAIVD